MLSPVFLPCPLVPTPRTVQSKENAFRISPHGNPYVLRRWPGVSKRLEMLREPLAPADFRDRGRDDHPSPRDTVRIAKAEQRPVYGMALAGRVMVV